MSFIRPEIAIRLKRFAEPTIWIAVAAFGASIAYTGSNLLLQIIGAVITVVAIFLVWISYRISLILTSGTGPGVVTITERQIIYFGPKGGASVSINDLTQVEIRTTANGPSAEDVFWIFRANDGTNLLIPGSAVGADQLIDGLAALPGIDNSAIIKAMGSAVEDRFLIWQTDRKRLH